MNSCQFKWSFVSLSHISRFMVYVSRLYVASFYSGEFPLMPWHHFQTLLLLFSHLVMFNSLWSRGMQHTRLSCPSLSPRVCSNSCSLSQWHHPTISSSIFPFSSCPQSFPASGFLQWIGCSHQVAKVLEFQLQHQSFQWIFSVDFL